MDNQKIAIIGIVVLGLVVGGLFFVTSDVNESNPEDENPSGILEATNTPNPDKSIDVRNDFNQTVEVRIEVLRNSTGEIVHNETYNVESGEELDEVYNLNESNPDGIEEYEVISTYNETEESLSVFTNNCYGNVYVEITDSGMLYSYYAIC